MLKFDATIPDLEQIEFWNTEATKYVGSAVAESVQDERMSGIDAFGRPFSKPGIDMYDTGEMLSTFVMSAQRAGPEGVTLQSSAPWGQRGPKEPDWSREGRYIWCGLSPRNIAASQVPTAKGSAEALMESAKRAQAGAKGSTPGGETRAASSRPVVAATPAQAAPPAAKPVIASEPDF